MLTEYTLDVSNVDISWFQTTVSYVIHNYLHSITLNINYFFFIKKRGKDCKGIWREDRKMNWEDKMKSWHGKIRNENNIIYGDNFSSKIGVTLYEDKMVDET